LAGEGFRFFDLVRTGKAAQEIGFVAGKNGYFLFRLKKFSFLVEWAQNLIIKSIIMKK
jgi:hypothetical protein